MSKECPSCFGMGTIEHKRCHGCGCDGCEDGELVCNKCDGLGFINEDGTKQDDPIDPTISDIEEMEEEVDNE